MSNTLRLLGLEALSSVGDLLWGSVASGEPALVLASGGRAKDFLREKACRLAGFEPADAARYDRLPESEVVAPRPDTRAALRLVRDCAAGKPEWFSVIADSESLFCHDPRPTGDLRVLPEWPGHGNRERRKDATPPSRPVAAGFALRPTPVPLALLQPKLALSYAPAPAPTDPDWTRLRHPEFAHIAAILAWERSERRTSLGGRVAAAASLGVVAALAAIAAVAFIF